MIRLYLDEDTMWGALVSALRTQQIDTLTTFEAGRLRRPDPDQLTFATASDRVICTGNIRDYTRLHAARLAAGDPHAGIIIIVPNPRTSIGDYTRALARLSEAHTPNTIRNHIEYLTAWLE